MTLIDTILYRDNHYYHESASNTDCHRLCDHSYLIGGSLDPAPNTNSSMNCRKTNPYSHTTTDPSSTGLYPPFANNGEVNTEPQLLALVLEYRSLLRNFVYELSSTQQFFPTAESRTLHSRLSRVCAAWLEALSQDASMASGSGTGTQIEALAQSVPLPLCGEAIISLLKTCILQSLLLSRLTTGLIERDSGSQVVEPADQTKGPSPYSRTIVGTRRESMNALHESLSDSTLTNLLKEVDLRRISPKISGVHPSEQISPAPGLPCDVGSLLRAAPMEDMSTLDGTKYDVSNIHGSPPQAVPGVGETLKSNMATLDDGDGTSLKEKSLPSSALTDMGVHVPQLDLDAIFMPSTDKSFVSMCPADSTWQRRLREDVRKVTWSLLMFRKGKNQSPSHPKLTIEAPLAVTEEHDLRPAWMTKPKMLAIIRSKLDPEEQPLYYAEWNILDFPKVKVSVYQYHCMQSCSSFESIFLFTQILNDPSQTQLVSPEYMLSSVPLRFMVSICHPVPSVMEPEIIHESQHKDFKIGVEFTIPADINVKYRVFHSSFSSESKWHDFKDKPWAGVNATESTEPRPHFINQTLTVGVIILEMRQNFSVRASNPYRKSDSHSQKDTGHGLMRSRADSHSTLSAGIPNSIEGNSGMPYVSWNSKSSYAGDGKTRPRAHSDWQSSITAPQQPLSSSLASVSDLLQLSAVAPDAFSLESFPNFAATPSRLLHESCPRINRDSDAGVSFKYDTDLYSEIWKNSGTSTPSFNDLVLGRF